MSSNSNRFWGWLRRVADWLIPESSFLYKRIYFSWRSFKFSKRNARQTKLTLVYITTDGCNLNCARCNTYAPLVKSPQMVELAQVEKDMARLSELFDGEVEKLEFMGGEILMHPNVVEILSLARKHLRGDIRMLTNGTLLHKMPSEFWKCCHDNHIHVMVTPYPIRLNYERIMALAEQYDVKLTCYTKDLWTRDKTFRKFALDLEGKCDAAKNFRRCPFVECQSLWDNGRIYRCNFPAFGRHLNEVFGTEFEFGEKDYIDIYEVKDKEEIFDFLTKPIPACRYCDLDNWEFGLQWKVSKKQREEWL